MKSLLFSLALGVVFCTGCRKDDEPQQIAGKGGPVALRVSVVHHTAPIDTGMVYLKYNASTAPADEKWDDSARITKLGSAPAQALFSGLKQGQYFISGIGYQGTNIPDYYQTLEGGFPYVIADTGDVKNVTLYITEPDGH